MLEDDAERFLRSGVVAGALTGGGYLRFDGTKLFVAARAGPSR
jgi:hypothetical protein